MEQHRHVPIPPRMKRLPRDRRGLPIPATVFIDCNGVPHFTINDEAKRRRFIKHDLCPICGATQNRARWFVGGPLSAFDPHGAYIDAPMHHECATYALQVCPYLAAPSYKRIDGATLKKSPGAKDQTAVFLDPTMMPERPDFFVALMSLGQIIDDQAPGQLYLAPIRPCRRVEFWRQGEKMPEAEGHALVAELLETPLPARQAPRLVVRSSRR